METSRRAATSGVGCLLGIIGVGSVGGALLMACVPPLPPEGPCAADACLDGYRCCDGWCKPADEPCLGACIDDRSDEGQRSRYLPFIVGARWTFLVTDIGSETRQWKRWALGPEVEIGGLADGRAHLQCREVRDGDGNLYDGSLRWELDTGHGALWQRSLRVDVSAPGEVAKDEYPDPFAIRLDEGPDTCVGRTFTHTYQELVVRPSACTGITFAEGEHWGADDPARCAEAGGLAIVDKTDVWTVQKIDEVVEVAGQELSTLRVRREQTSSDSQIPEIATFWFARGVGKVMEVTENKQQEELLFVDMPDVGMLGQDDDRAAQIDDCSLDWWPRRDPIAN